MNNKIKSFVAVLVTACIAGMHQPTQASPFPQRECSLFCLDLDRYCRATGWSDGYLRRNRFRRVSSRSGAIVVMQRNFACSNTAYGHVGVDESIDQKGAIFLGIASVLLCLAGFVRANLIFLDYYRYSVLRDLNTFSNLSSCQLAQI